MADDKRNINLMPEDLRVKESEVLAKKQDSFQIDLIVPEGQAKPKQKSSQSFWQKLAGIFKKPPHFIEPVKKPVEEKKPKDKDKHKKDDLVLDLDKPQTTKTPKTEEIYHKIVKEKPAEVTPAPVPEIKDNFFVKGLPEDRSNNWSPKAEEEVKEKPVEGIVDIFKEPANKTLEVVTPLSPPPPKSEPSPAPVPPPKKDFFIPELTPEKKVSKSEPVKATPPVKESKFHQPVGGLSNRFVNNGGGVDLIPVAVKTRSWRQIIMLLVFSIVGSALIVGIFYGALFVQGKNIADQEAARALQISDLEKQILDYEDMNKEIQDLGGDIVLVHNVLKKHIYWTNFFALLEKYTIQDVYYRGLTAGNNGALTLQAVGKNFSSVARQLKVLEQDSAKEFVTEASVDGAKDTQGGIEFQITLVLNPDLFYYDSQSESSATSTPTN